VDQVEFLRAHHCDEIQGYYFSRPLPYADLLTKLQSHAQEAGTRTEAAPAPPIIVWP